MKIYMAGPIQFAHDDGKGWRERVKDRYPYIDWLDPFDKYDATDPDEVEWTDESIVEEDLALIDESDGVLVHWEEVPTCGTPMEVRYAHQTDTPTAVQTTCDDLSPWLTYHVDGVYETFQNAIVALQQHE